MAKIAQQIEFEIHAETADEAGTAAEETLQRYAAGRTWKIHEIRVEPHVVGSTHGRIMSWEVHVRGEIIRET